MADQVNIIAPMPCSIVEISVGIGDPVEIGAQVMVIESMKMEVPILSEVSGNVSEVLVAPGDAVEAEAVLMRLKA